MRRAIAVSAADKLQQLLRRIDEIIYCYKKDGEYKQYVLSPARDVSTQVLHDLAHGVPGAYVIGESVLPSVENLENFEQSL